MFSVRLAKPFSASSSLPSVQPERSVKQLPVYLIGFHISAGEVFHTVHEAVLRHLVVRSQKLFKLQSEQRNIQRQ